MASFFAEDGAITVNNGDKQKGRAAIAEMAAGFYAEFPDIIVHCDEARLACTHALFAWTLEGRRVRTKNFVKVAGWEEWELDGDGKSSLGWFGATECGRQIEDGK